MASDRHPEQGPAANNELEITLGLLNAIERDSTVTQRTLASELGIALGLANAYLRRCTKKGLIKISQAPARRYVYYLTPFGLAEKSRLTARYLTQSFYLFRHARQQYDDLLAFCATRSWHRVAFAGVGDLAEIAVLCAANHGLKPVGLLGDVQDGSTFHGCPVVTRLKDLGHVDAVLVTDMRSPQAVFDALVQVFPRDRLLTPRLLSVSREAPRPVDAQDSDAT